VLEQTTITFGRESAQVIARIDGPRLSAPPTAAPTSQRYAEITTALRERGLLCGVDYGMSDFYVWAELPDGGNLYVSPPQEPAEAHPPRAWRAGAETDSLPYDVWWDSEPGGPDSVHAGSIPHLLAALDRRLDGLGLPPRKDTRPVLNEAGAEAALHRSGFVPVTLGADRFHRLPLAMTDPAEQRQSVTRAVDMLHPEGFAVSCDPDLLEPGLPHPNAYGMSLGDRLGLLNQSIQASTHTQEAVGALSELTAPSDGVLQRVVDVLGTTADWWEGLGEPTDLRNAIQLRYITERLGSFAREIRAMRGNLADRHAAHPDKVQIRADQTIPKEPGSVRANAARATSPTVRRTGSTSPPLPGAPAVRPALPPSSFSAPGR
jgi:hypothetical protein